MSRALLDVNILLALLDSDHPDHIKATDWLGEYLPQGWASCAITENGFIRVITQHRYSSPVSPAQAFSLLGNACGTEWHEFWPCDVSVTDPSALDFTRLHGSRQVTDAYLLALAVRHDGALVTLDRSISLAAARGAKPDNLVII